MIFLPIILLDILTVMFAVMEAWGFSRTGYDGLKELLGEKIEDHSLFKVERFVAWMLAVWYYGMALLSIPFPRTKTEMLIQVLIISASWGGKFMFIHQYVYNWTMWRLKINGYKIGIEESKNTTSTKSNNAVRITLAIFGVLTPVAYYLI